MLSLDKLVSKRASKEQKENLRKQLEKYENNREAQQKVKELFLVRNELATDEEILEATCESMRFKNADLFKMTNTDFGTAWAEKYVLDRLPGAVPASKEYDECYSKDYDIMYKGLKIEVKASRAADVSLKGKPLSEKIFKRKSLKSFEMNFQQIKPYCFDYVVLVGVWGDSEQMWLLSKEEILAMNGLNMQHRGNQNEYQLHITRKNIMNLDKYRITTQQLNNRMKAIIKMR